MSIKLNAQSGGSVALEAPTQTTGSANLTFTLPVADGSSGQVLKTDGSSNLSFGAAAGAGQIIETVAGMCDGRSVTVGSGTYTFGNVTSVQAFDTTYTDITGSSIAYTPPTGTKALIYAFDFMWEAASTSGISFHQILIDGTVVTQSKTCVASDYNSYHHAHMAQTAYWVFDLSVGSNDYANGKVQGSAWTSNKTIKVQMRESDNSSYNVKVHNNHFMDGSTLTGDNGLRIPKLQITAIA
tara:strand:+ start:50 stop:769 length:720 start_codon:yes stop_codon:yes gene_type:complete